MNENDVPELPGAMLVRSPSERTLRSVNASLPSAITDTDTLCAFSSRRRAVTMMFPVASAAFALCDAGVEAFEFAAV